MHKTMKRLLSMKGNSDNIQILFIPEMECWLDVINMGLKLNSALYLQANDSPHMYGLLFIVDTVFIILKYHLYSQIF